MRRVSCQLCKVHAVIGNDAVALGLGLYYAVTQQSEARPLTGRVEDKMEEEWNAERNPHGNDSAYPI